MFSFPDACRLLGISLIHPDPAASITGASIDTRTLQPGDLFAALPGARTDGHEFLESAFLKGAAGALVEKKFFQEHPERFQTFRNILPVSEVDKALAVLAAGYRDSFRLSVIGITGSVGKTSTKEFLSYLLGLKAPVLSNQGNFNNHLGLPLTLFRLRPEHRFCVAELGASHGGEILSLAALLKPQLAVITQISPCHISGFGSLEAIYKAKLELLESLSSGSTAILPDHDPVLIEKAKKLGVRLILVGKSDQADYRLSGVRLENSHVHFQLNGKNFSFPGIAPFLAQNAALACAAAEQMGAGLETLPEIWQDLRLPHGRFEEQWMDQIRIIFDGYNASPASFNAALDTFSAMNVSGRKFLVFSDMLELGEEERKYHELLGKKIGESTIDYGIAYGTLAGLAAEAACKESPGKNIRHFAHSSEAGIFLNEQLREGDSVLLKASRGMKIEEVLKFLRPKTAAG